MKDIEVTRIVKKPTRKYKVSELQRIFGVNGRIVIKDISNLFANYKFLSAIPKLYPALDKFKAQMREDLVDEIRNKLKVLNGDIISQINDSFFNNIEADPYYKEAFYILSHYVTTNSKLDTFQIFFQLNKLYQNHKSELTELSHWANYEEYKRRLEDSIQRFNTSTWAHAEMHETKGNLVIKFPKADELSNGQRDILTFITQLIIANSKLSNTKKNLVIIDEVFDYMDDGKRLRDCVL